jgi:hypothetical protein
MTTGLMMAVWISILTAISLSAPHGDRIRWVGQLVIILSFTLGMIEAGEIESGEENAYKYIIRYACLLAFILYEGIIFYYSFKSIH